MSLQGNAIPKAKVRGSINILRTEVINAYEIAVQNGFDGTVDEWLESLRGDPGAVFIPEVDEEGNLNWTNDGGLPNPLTVNIRGVPGEPGTPGRDGKDGADAIPPEKGKDYYTEEDKAEMEAAVVARFSQPARMSVVKSGSNITITAPQVNGSTRTYDITLDANNYPVKVVTDGVECPITLEGFDVV